jgi:hypothetical protein
VTVVAQLRIASAREVQSPTVAFDRFHKVAEFDAVLIPQNLHIPRELASLNFLRHEPGESLLTSRQFEPFGRLAENHAQVVHMTLNITRQG